MKKHEMNGMKDGIFLISALMGKNISSCKKKEGKYYRVVKKIE